MSDNTSFNVTAAHITQSPGVAGGEPCIAGRRIKVRHVCVWYDLVGLTADEIASKHNLTLAQVHAALTYAYEHLDEIREAIRAEDELVEKMKEKYASKHQTLNIHNTPFPSSRRLGFAEARVFYPLLP